MSSSDKELEQQLMEAGTRLMDPSPSVEELLPLLDQVENCLSKVEQSPSQSMQNALSPSLKALVTEQIFRHPDADVKVAVASCISEITRITAPDAPYDDEQMKEVFQLIVSSFENLFDKSSRSYAKRTSILETVAKVRSCVVMLDLECDALIIEMFQHFFKTIRDYHPENVFASMETIMTLVLEESEDISMELLSPLLACVKRDNEEVMPVARKLAERVIKTCGDKLKPCLTEAVKTLGISLDDYSEVIASICQDASKNNSQDDDDDDDDAIKNQEVHENKPDIASLDGTVEGQNINPGEVNPAKEVDIPNEKSGKSSISNGSVQENDSLKDTNFSEKQELVAVESSVDAPTVHESGVMPADNMVNSESAEKDTSKKGSTSVSLKSEPSGSPSVNDKEVGSQHEKRCEDKHDPNAHNEDLADTAVLSSENQEVMGDKSSLKDTESADDVGSPTHSSDGADDNINNKKTENKQGMIEEAAAADIPKAVDADAPKTGSGEKSEMEENSSRLMKKKVTKQTEKKESTTEAEASDDDAPKAGLEGKSELETKSTSLVKKKVNKQTEKKEATTEAESSDDDAPKTGLEGKSELETKSSRLMKKKPAAGTSTEDKTLSDIDESNGESGGASDLEAKLQLIKSPNEGKRDLKTKSSKHSGKKVATGVSSEDKIQSANDETKEESGDASDMEVDEPKQPIMRKKGAMDSEVKVSRRKGKKVASGASIGKFLSVADETKEEEIDASDSESKPLKQSIKKANSRKQSGKKSVSKHPANKKKGSGGKDVLEKAEQKSSEKTDTEEMDISPKSFKENNDEPHLEETPKSTPKRKPSGSKASRFVECNESLVGLKVKVWWPQDKMFYEGVVESFDRKKKRHKVLYDDGDQEILNMRTQRFEVIEDEDKPSENEGTDHASSGASPEMSPKKKMKTADKSTEKADLDASPKKARVASSSKTKVAVGKSGQKLHDAAKSGGNSKGGTKSGSKLENDSATQGNKTGSSFKAAESSSKASGKSRNDDSITPKSSKSKDDAAGLQKSAKSKEDASRSSKSKQEVPKTSSGKIPSTAAKSSGNGSNKRKSGVLKTTESDSVEELLKTPKSKSIKKRRR